MNNKFESLNRAPNPIKEFFVEFLGGLVPGVAFLFAIFPAFVIPMFSIMLTFFPFPEIQKLLCALSDKVVAQGNPLLISINIIIFLLIPAMIVFFCFAYIIGHLASRQSYKIVDDASLHWISRHYGKSSKAQPDISHAIIGNLNSSPIEWPYHIKEYLNKRGVQYLANIVPPDESGFIKRSKLYMNALKLRIHMVSSEGSAILARSEAHSRLTGAMWFISKILIIASTISLIISFASGLFSIFYLKGSSIAYKESGIVYLIGSNSLNYIWVFGILCPVFILVLNFLMRKGILRSFHFQRQREVFYILEVAYWLSINGFCPHIFEGLLDINEHSKS